MTIKTLLLSPILVAQALWVVARAARLPEAAGPRSGEIGTGAPLRLLVVGDSSAAGVGVAHQREALSGCLCAALQEHYAVRWKVIAKSGATTASVLSMLNDAPDEEMDFVMVAVGVNDAKNGVSDRAWIDRYTALLDLVETKFSPKKLCISGLPPLAHFPLLPRPLSTVIGARAERFDMALATLCATRTGATHLPFDAAPTAADMAEDGFHPNARVYRDWAQRAVEHCFERSA